MENIKEYLKKEIAGEIEEIEKEIKESDRDIRIWEARVKVEKKLATFTDLDEDMESNVKYGTIALEDFLLMEKNRNKELKNERKLIIRRKKSIDQFEEEEL